MISFLEECKRKLIHLSSLWIPILYIYTEPQMMIKMIVSLTLIVVFIDLGRHKFQYLAQVTNILFSNIIRSHEKNPYSLSGASNMLIGVSFSIIAFSKEIAILSIVILIICDMSSALIGRKFGRIKILDKSLEGSLAFLMSGLVVCYIFIYYIQFSLSIKSSFIALFFATFAELISKQIKLDDNLVIPLVFGSSLSILNHYF